VLGKAQWLGLLAGLVVALLARVVTAAPAVPEGFEPPKLLNAVQVEYPEALAGEEDPPAGAVVIKYTVGTDGVPRGLSVEQSVHPQLDALVLEAVAKLRYEPATIEGKPVEVVLRISVQLQPPALEEESEPAPEPPAPDQPAPEPPEPDAGPVRVFGSVLEAGQRTPVAGATVIALPAPADAELGKVRKTSYAGQAAPAWQRQASTDADGTFELRGIPDGKLRVIVLAPGYERLEHVESIARGEKLELRYFVARATDNPFTTVVEHQRSREEVTRHSVNVEEIRNLPGTQGDALKAVQNFPGVARAPFGIGLFVIRGADPTDSSVYLGHHEIPQLFHFGGITSVFNADVITTIDYIPGNFDARYVDAIGGIIDVHTRPGRRDGVHGYVDSDLFDTGVLLEGPLGKGSFVISGRRSYIDLLLPAVIPDDAGLDVTIAPRYYDYQVLLDYPVSRGNLSVKVFGSDDRARLVAADPNDVSTDQRNQFETTLQFHRVDLVYENRRGPWDFLITPSYRYDRAQAGAGDLFRFTLTGHSLSTRVEVGRRVAKRVRWDVGTQMFTGVFRIDAEAPPVPTGGFGSSDIVLSSESEDLFFAPSLYGTLSIGLGDRFTLYPGLSTTYYAVLFNRFSTDPRLRFAWQVADRTTIKGGVGLYSQLPDIFEWNANWGNPDLGLERALHTSVSVVQELDPAITIEVAGFYKTLWDLAAPSPDLIRNREGLVRPEAFTNKGTGRIVGGELFFRKELTKALFGWVSYTISRSERKPSPSEAFRIFDFDQTHILTMIGVYRLPRNWQVGARFRLVSGNPYTPVVSATYDGGNDEYIPIYGRPNSRRVAPFHQLDLRVDKRFVWKRVMLTVYLDVQNVYNHQNPEFRTYSFDYTVSRDIPSLPIIPSLGLKLEF
jgi:TonB family protein